MPQFSTSTSGADAKKKMWLAPHDGITMNRDRLLADAKARAIAMVPGYEPPKPAAFSLSGESAATAFRSAVDDFDLKGMVTWHDIAVADAMGTVVSGGDTHAGIRLTENDMQQLEREGFMSLIRTDGTKARIAHIIKTGKPLREEPFARKKDIDELRALREPVSLPYRVIDGKPLSGADEKTLRRMAEGAELALNAHNGQYKGLKGALSALEKTARIIAPPAP